MTAIVDMNWLTGVWHGKHNDQHIDEYWGKPVGETMVGTSRHFQGDSLILIELIALEKEADSIVLRIKHFNPGLVTWEEKDEASKFILQEAKPNEAHFTLKQDDGHEQHRIYKRENNTLTVTTRVTSANGTSTEAYSFEQQTI